MKKLLEIAVIFLFLSVSVIPSTGTTDVKQITMTTSKGDTLYVGGNGTGNYSKIQDAIDNASDGDTVYVYDGTYYENLNVSKSINLFGENRKNTIIDGNKSGDVVAITTDWVNISGFTVRNSENSSDNFGIIIYSDCISIIDNDIIDNYMGLYLAFSRKNTIVRNSIHANYRRGILLINSNDNIIHENNITNTKTGIFLVESNNNTISDNRIDKCSGFALALEDYSKNNKITNNSAKYIRGGIYFLDTRNNVINGNTFLHSKYGLVFYDSHKNWLSDNTIRFVEDEGIYISECSEIDIISGNFITNNDKGIRLIDSGGCVISGNVISNNSIGILLDESSNCEISRNYIEYNREDGINLDFSFFNIITENNFIENNRDAYYKTDFFADNRWFRNYWDTWRIFPKPILGRKYGIIFSSNWVKFDWMPASEPYGYKIKDGKNAKYTD